MKFIQNLKALQIQHNRQILQQHHISTTEWYKTQSKFLQAYTIKKLWKRKCNTLFAAVKTTVEKHRNFRAKKSQQIRQWGYNINEMSLKLISSKTRTYLPQSTRWKQILLKKLTQGNKPKWRPEINKFKPSLHSSSFLSRNAWPENQAILKNRVGGAFDRKIVKRVNQQNEAKQIKNKCW